MRKKVWKYDRTYEAIFLQELAANSRKKVHLMMLQAQVEEMEKSREAMKASRIAEAQSRNQEMELEKARIEVAYTLPTA